MKSKRTLFSFWLLLSINERTREPKGCKQRECVYREYDYLSASVTAAAAVAAMPWMMILQWPQCVLNVSEPVTNTHSLHTYIVCGWLASTNSCCSDWRHVSLPCRLRHLHLSLCLRRDDKRAMYNRPSQMDLSCSHWPPVRRPDCNPYSY